MLALAALWVTAQSPAPLNKPALAPSPYRSGQIWEYRTRPQDAGSLLKIQRVETDPMLLAAGPIYHITVIGVHLANPQVKDLLSHAPVSRDTLDASVTRPAHTSARFPSADDGITQWKKAKGGVFTIPVREIVDIVDKQTKASTK